MSVHDEHVPAEVATAEAEAGRSPRAVWAAVWSFLAVAGALTWWRLQRGADLVDEAFSVLVPWRWALGDRPFVDEQNLSQSAGLISYPFVRLFALVGGNDVDGLVLYDRHLYLALGVLTAGCVFLLVRRSLPGSLAVLVAAPFVTVVLFETPQVTANTLAALLLSAGAALSAAAILGGSRRLALYAGVATGLAGVAYPTVLLMTPFVAVLLAFSQGERTVLLLGRTSASPPADPVASGLRAWRLVSAWALGGVLVVVPLAATVVAVAGVANLRRAWDYTISLARDLDQLGGTAKAAEITVALGSLLLDQWYIVVAALASLAVLYLRPGAGRWLLLLTPAAVWLTGTTSGLGAAGAVILYGLSAPYLYLFLPAARRSDGARLLAGVWAPAVVIGTMTAYTSADGLVRAAVGLLSGVVVSGLFLAWGLQPLGRGRAGVSWAAIAGSAAIVVATLAFQVQFLPGGVSPSELFARMPDGPWRGIALTEPQRDLLDSYSADLARQARTDDGVLAYPQAAALYLFWPGEIAANTYQLYVDRPSAHLPKATVSYYRRHREAPTLVTHVLSTAGKTPERLREESGGLDYPTVTVRPGYVIQRKPPAESVDEVLARLPRL
jgi:hypothetical protein